MNVKVIFTLAFSYFVMRAEVVTIRSSLSLYGINVPTREIESILVSSPHYPSIYSYVETLKYFGLNCSAYQLPLEVLSKSHLPLIALLSSTNQSNDPVLKLVTGENITREVRHVNDNTGSKGDDRSYNWSGVIIKTTKETPCAKSWTRISHSSYAFSILSLLPFLIGLIIVYRGGSIGVTYLLIYLLSLFGHYLSLSL